MSELESFSGFDAGGDAMDAAAFEKFKERMKRAAAQLKAIQAGEQKQKKTEDELVRLLLKFIQTGNKRDLMLLVSRLLEENIPASFIVSLLLISNREMQQELGLKMLPSGPAHDYPEDSDMETLPDRYLQGSVLPLKIKIAIDTWLNEIFKRASDVPHRILKTVLTPDGTIKLPVTQLATFSLRDFLEEEGVETKYESLKNFMDMMLEGIIKKLQEQIADQKEIKGGPEDN
jgi:hypothetical protein